MSNQNNQNNQGPFVLIILLLATVVATIFIFRIFGGSFEDKPAKFWVSLCAIIFAEVLTFGAAIWLGNRSDFDNKMFPYNLSLLGIISSYDVSVLFISLIALTPIGSDWIVSLHVLLLLFVCIMITAFHYGGGLVSRIEVTETQQRKPAIWHRSQIADLVDRAGRLNGVGSESIQSAINSLQEELEYATSDSLPGSENIDNEINTQIGQLTGLIIAAENCGSNDEAATATAKELVEKTTDLKTSISKRDRMMMELRG